MRDLGDGEGGYVADALGRTMLLPADVDGLKKMRMQEVFLTDGVNCTDTICDDP